MTIKPVATPPRIVLTSGGLGADDGVVGLAVDDAEDEAIALTVGDGYDVFGGYLGLLAAEADDVTFSLVAGAVPFAVEII